MDVITEIELIVIQW